MKIIAKFDSSKIKIVEVQPYEPVNTLLPKLNIADKNSKFLFDGMTMVSGLLKHLQK